MPVRLRHALDSIPVYRPGCCPEERGALSAVKLSSNESPWQPPTRVIDAITEAAGTLNRYPDFYKVALTAHLSHVNGVATDRIAIDNGSGTLLQDLVRIVADQGDKVVFGTPSFAAYEIDVVLAGAIPVKVPLDAAYTYDLAALQEAVDSSTRMVIVCNPNNPTGTFIGTDDLRRFLRTVPNEVLVVVDEAYHEFVTSEDSDASLSLLEEFDNLVLLRTFSKAFGLAGLRVGYCFASPDIVDALSKTIAEFSVSTVAQAAGIACLEPATRVLLENRTAEIVHLRDAFQDRLTEAGIPFIPSQSNFVMLLGDSDEGFQKMQEHGIIVRPFENPRGIRITIGDKESMGKVLDALGLTW